MTFTKNTKLSQELQIIGYDGEKKLFLVKDKKTNEKKWIKDYIIEAMKIEEK